MTTIMFAMFYSANGLYRSLRSITTYICVPLGDGAESYPGYITSDSKNFGTLIATEMRMTGTTYLKRRRLQRKEISK